MTAEKGEGRDPFGASHICGGSCINHGYPEPNSVNQARKPHHARMVGALERGSIEGYHAVRDSCGHLPKCFINPGARGLRDRLISNNHEAYIQARAEANSDEEDAED